MNVHSALGKLIIAENTQSRIRATRYENVNNRLVRCVCDQTGNTNTENIMELQTYTNKYGWKTIFTWRDIDAKFTWSMKSSTSERIEEIAMAKAEALSENLETVKKTFDHLLVFYKGMFSN
jgi:hypothetical protein